MARSGGFKYRPTISCNLSANSGSLLTLKVLIKWGFRPWARQIRRTLASLMPAASAMVRVLHWVAWAGFWRVVMSTTRLIRRALILGVLPGRGASFSRPASPNRRKRLRQRETFFGVRESERAISL